MANVFEGKGLLIGGILHLFPREAYEAVRAGAVLVDVREEYLRDFKAFDVPNATFLPFSKLKKSAAELPAELPKDRPLILADSLGLCSKEAVRFLKDRGFENVANLNGGISEWENSGLPLKQNSRARMNGACICRLSAHPG